MRTIQAISNARSVEWVGPFVAMTERATESRSSGVFLIKSYQTKKPEKRKAVSVGAAAMAMLLKKVIALKVYDQNLPCISTSDLK